MPDQLTASAPPLAALSVTSDPSVATTALPAELRALAEQPLDADRRSHPGRWVLSAIVLAAVAWLLYKIASNNKIGWSFTWHYLFSSAILHGLLVTLELTAMGQAVAIIVGVLLAACGESHNPVLVALARAYVWFFRSVPLLVQILAWYNLAIVFPTLAIGIPGTSWHVQGSTNTIITPFLASVLALGLAEGAYMAEIVRAGIVSVARGQVDAGLSLGLTQRQTMRRIVLPQTLRVVVPPTGNQLIGLVKACALVSVIGGDELLTSAQRIYSVNFRIIALLLDVTIWYLVLTTVLTIGQHYLERWLDRESLGGERGNGADAPSLASRWRKNLGPRRSALDLSTPDFDQEVSL